MHVDGGSRGNPGPAGAGVTISAEDVNLYKSARNIPKVAVALVGELNAGDICSRRKMLFTKEAFLSVLNTGQTSEV